MRHFNLNTRAILMSTAALVLVSGLPLQATEQDGRIVTSATNSYNFRTYLKDDSIHVASAGGVVTLTGTVSQDYHRNLAEETVLGLPGVTSVNNQLSVSGTQPAERSDGWITMKVKSALAFHEHVSATNTEVNTQGGVVTLTGSADSEAQKQLTAEYAKDVDGVTDIHNQLVVTKPAKPAHEGMGAKVDDASITAQVKTTLLFHKSTHALATKVTTKNGMVSLHGEAQNAAERDLVTKLASDITGVKHVSNRMTIQKS